MTAAAAWSALVTLAALVCCRHATAASVVAKSVLIVWRVESVALLLVVALYQVAGLPPPQNVVLSLAVVPW